MIRQLAVRTANRYAPLVLLGNSPMTTLPLTPAPLCQIFRADRSHLRRIELRFEALGELHIGALHITLYAGDCQGDVVLQRDVSAATINPNVPLQLEFTPQVESFQHLYTLVIRASSDHAMHGLAIRRFFFTQHDGAVLQRGNKQLAGQLAFQAFYGEAEPYIQSARRGPLHWNAEVRPTTDLIDETATRATGASRELVRLAARMFAVLRQHGLRGLAAEAVSYLQWHLGSADDAG